MRLILLMVFLSMGCSVQKLALKQVSCLMEVSSDQILSEPNLDHFDSGAIANIKFLEGMWFADQSNKTLTTLIINAYAGYGFAVGETQFLEKQLSGNDEESDKKAALVSYSKSLRYGLHYYKLLGGKKSFFKLGPDKLQDWLRAQAKEEDLKALFYFGQAMGGMINLNR